MTRPLVLGVERSASGRRWEARGTSVRAAETLAQRLGISAALAAILEARGVSPEYGPHFLEPKLRELMPDPASLQDMEKATALLADALAQGKQIAILGDYDVDGVASTAMLYKGLVGLGAKPPLLYIPDRQTEGYGPNSAAIETLHAKGAALLITVDCGISAHAPLERAKALGLPVLVLDHHKAEPLLPPADAIVNPNRLDDTSGLESLCAAGVSFLFLVGLQRHLQAQGWFQGDRRPLDLRLALDLAALATVADVVPLSGFNRVLVRQGLEVIRQRHNLGLAALLDLCKLYDGLDAGTLGYQLGPRINAGGRVGHALIGVELLTTQDARRAAEIAQHLDYQNEQRKALEAAITEQAVAQVQGATAPTRLALAQGQGWHEGVIGIVAGRLKQQYHRPALVLSWDGGVAKGSSRSIPGFDLGAMVIAARQKGLLVSGGGHAMAAGLSVTRDKLADFLAFAEQRLADISDTDLVPKMGIDTVIGLSAARFSTLEDLQRAAPFGQANPEPRFALSSLQLAYLSEVGAGKEHYRLRFRDASGKTLKAMAFRAAGTEIGRCLLQAQVRKTPVHVAGQLRADKWSGPEAVQLLLDDVAPA